MLAWTPAAGRWCAAPYLSEILIAALYVAKPGGSNAITLRRCSASPAKTLTIRTASRRFAVIAISRKREKRLDTKFPGERRGRHCCAIYPGLEIRQKAYYDRTYD